MTAPAFKTRASKTPSKTGVTGCLGRRQAPFETRTVAEVVTLARALLRGSPNAADAAKMSRRLTRLEDWLELERPRDDRTPLQSLRRQLEARSGGQQ